MVERLARNFDVQPISLLAEFESRSNDDSPMSSSVLKLDESGLSFLLGKNGSGKSLLIRGIQSLSDGEENSFPKVSMVAILPTKSQQDQWFQCLAERDSLGWVLEEESKTRTPWDLDRARYDFAHLPFMNAILESFHRSTHDFEAPFRDMSKEDVLKWFECDQENLSSWKSQERNKIQKQDEGDSANVFEEYAVRDSFSLHNQVAAIFLALLSNSRINQGFHPDSLIMTKSLKWINDSVNAKKVFDAVTQLANSSTHIRLTAGPRYGRNPDGSGVHNFSLLAPIPSSGPLAELLTASSAELDELNATNSDRLDSIDFAFPFDLFKISKIGSETFVESSSFSLAERKAYVERLSWRALDAVTISSLRGSAETFSLLSTELLKYLKKSVYSPKEGNSVMVTFFGYERIREWIAQVGSTLQSASIGIDGLRIKVDDQQFEEKPNASRWEMSESTPKNDFLPIIQWRDSNSKIWLPIGNASQGQQDAISMLVKFGLLHQRRDDSAFRILLADEFDKHLHPRAAEQLFAALHRRAWRNDVMILTSTHNVPQFNSFQMRNRKRIVARRGFWGEIYYSENGFGSKSDAEETLGVFATEVRRLKKIHVVVEGDHEVQILEHLFRDEDELFESVDLVNPGGLSGYKIAWQKYLADSTLPILIVYDKRNEKLEKAWTEAREISLDPTSQDILWDKSGLNKIQQDWWRRTNDKKNRKERSPSSDHELGMIIYLLKDILSWNVVEAVPRNICRVNDLKSLRRVFLHGVDCDDIVDTLPIGEFPLATKYTSWKNAHALFQNIDGKQFKKQMGVNPMTISSALENSMDIVHPEHQRLYSAINGLVDKPYDLT